MSLEDLHPFVGRWDVTAEFPRTADVEPMDGTTEFAWLLNGTFLTQRGEVDHPDAPAMYAVIAAGEDGGYVQHYFDSRDVVRTYQMGFDGTVWTLERSQPDFSPLDFAQRFTATFEDPDTIVGHWDIQVPDEDWQHDFAITYRRHGGG